MLNTMEFFLDKNYFDEIRNATQDAINYAIRNHQELVEEALAQTEKIRYSKYVSGLGPWCPFFSNRDDDASFPLFDSPKRFKSGDYTAYHLDQSGNLLILRNFVRQKLESEYLLFERQGVEYAVMFSHSEIQNGYQDSFTTYRMTTEEGRLQESFGLNNLIVYGEHIDWHEHSGEGYFLCSSFLYPTYYPQAPGQPAYEMDRQRFVIKDNQISDIVLEMEKTVYSA